jgi:Carbamoyltransferase N-terminus
LGHHRRSGFSGYSSQEQQRNSNESWRLKHLLTLGINYSQMHDSSACIVRDGELFFAVAEERLSRIKHDAGFPRLAIQACLDFAGVPAGQLDEVCFGWPHAGAAFRHDLRCFATAKMPANYLNVLNSTLHFLSMGHQQGGAKRFTQHFGKVKARMRFVDHHLAHAISAYAYSGFADSAVVVMDGRGAWEATSIWHGHDGRLDHVMTIPFPDSIGHFYSEFTAYLGFQRNSDEWKVMGLAPYGKPGVDLSAFIDPQGPLAHPYRAHTKRLFSSNSKPFAGIAELLGPPRVPESEIDERHKNIAYAVQEMCEIAMMSVVKMAMQTNFLCNPRPPMMASRWAPRWLLTLTAAENFPIAPCAMLTWAPLSTTRPLSPSCAPINCATRAWTMSLPASPNSSLREKLSAGFRAAWSSVPAPLAADPSSPIRATRR